MPSSQRSTFPVRFSAAFCLLALLFGILLPAGGASRADVLGQVIVRASAWLVLLALVVVGNRPTLGAARWPAVILTAAIMIVLLQLVPLPPSLWQMLPGRAILAEAAAVSGQSQPWRPLAMVPDATLNAAGSLIVPVAVLILMAGLRGREASWILGLLVMLVAIGMLVGLVQFSGGGFDNPLVNDDPGEVSGTFANRNHFALFVGFACLFAPVWAFSEGRRPGWRGPIALGLVLLAVLTILATGSRAGMVVGAIATALGLFMTQKAIRRELSGTPRWVFPAVIASIVIVLAALVAISLTADRAQSINRLVAIDASSDTRVRALPTVLSMIQAYFPAGAGFGGFDPVFRINEPFDLLKPTYFNHAHSDFLEVVLDGGLPAALLLLGAIGWWAWASVVAWRAPAGSGATLARLGSSVLLLVMIASLVDYPARTPLVMAITVVAAIWLGTAAKARTGPPLPTHERQL